MARVTIEDSMAHCPNIFFLIQLAAKRAHQLQRGAAPKIAVRKTKEGRVDAPTVFALREIAAGFIDFDNEEIPERDAFGKLVFKQKRDYQKTEREQLARNENTENPGTHYAVRNKSTGEIIKTDMTLDEATEFKGKLVERVIELQEQKRG